MELDQYFKITQSSSYFSIALGPDLLFVDLLEVRLRFFGVVPEIWVLCVLLFFFDLNQLLVYVKDTSLALLHAQQGLALALSLSWCENTIFGVLGKEFCGRIAGV